MIRFKSFIFSITAIAILFVSCQSDNYTLSDQVEQRLVFQQYHISYDANTELLHATARFSLNNPTGITLKLAKKSRINWNNEELSGKSTTDDGYIYTLNKKIPYPEKSTFEYINNDGKIFSNEPYIPFFEINESGTISIDREKGAVLSYTGKKFREEELLFCSLFQNNELVSTFEPDIPEGKTITISTNVLYNLKPGNYTCRFTRSYSSSDIRALDRGGWYDSEYLSKTTDLKIY